MTAETAEESARRAPREGATPSPGAGGVRARPELALADDAFVLSHRLGEWAGHAPVLEEEVALANIALDLLGQARVLYSALGDEDELVYLRDERDFRNCQLVEQPNGDFAHTIARQLFFSTHQELLLTQLAAHGHGLAAKAVHETAYHRDHAEHWTLRLGDGTEESHARMQRAVDALWRFTGELFEPLALGGSGDDSAGAGGADGRGGVGSSAGVASAAGAGADGTGGIDEAAVAALDPASLRAEWSERIGRVLTAATLTVPDGPQRASWSAGGGRQGVHTEPFGRMLAELQHLHRSHPGARW